MVENVHLSKLIDMQARRLGNRVAIMYRDSCVEFWHEVAWNMLAQTVNRTANALLTLGIRPQQKIMIYAENMPECLYASFGAYMVKAVTIPVFATLNVTRLKYIIDEAEVSYVFVGEQKQYDTAFALYALCPSLVKLIMCDRNIIRKPIDKTSVYFSEFLELGDGKNNSKEIETRLKSASYDDIADIIYTSGTTGESKGVIITYDMYREALRANSLFIPLDENDIVLDFLPLSHIFERAWSFFSLAKGAIMALNIHPHSVGRSMYKIRPTAMCVVPHFWEKIYENVREEIENSPEERRNILEEALCTGHERNVVYGGDKNKIPENIEE